MPFHKSNYGAFGANLPADMDGYVPEPGDNPFRGKWDHGSERTHDENGELTEYGQWWEEEGFPELLERVEKAKKESDAQLEKWRDDNT